MYQMMVVLKIIFLQKIEYFFTITNYNSKKQRIIDEDYESMWNTKLRSCKRTKRCTNTNIYIYDSIINIYMEFI